MFWYAITDKSHCTPAVFNILFVVQQGTILLSTYDVQQQRTKQGSIGIITVGNCILP